MLRVGKQRRFPRSAFNRRLLQMLDDLDNWKRFYEDKRRVADTPFLRQRLDERIQIIDRAWHQVEKGLETMEDLSWH